MTRLLIILARTSVEMDTHVTVVSTDQLSVPLSQLCNHWLNCDSNATPCCVPTRRET